MRDQSQTPTLRSEKSSPEQLEHELDESLPAPPSYGSRSPWGSRRGSLAASTRSPGFLENMKYEVIVNHLYHQQCLRRWVTNDSGMVEGVIMRRARGEYFACPPALSQSPFAQACTAMNVQCAMTVSSQPIRAFLDWAPLATGVPLRNGLDVQIVPTIDHLAVARKLQFAACVASEGLLVVWGDDPAELVSRATEIEAGLMDVVWRGGVGDDDDAATATDEKEKARVQVHATEMDVDEESGGVEKRKLNLQSAFLVSVSMCLMLLPLGAAFGKLGLEITVDGSYLRLALLAVVPIQMFFTLFFAQSLVNSLAQIFGPIKQMTENSKYFSGRLPPRLMPSAGTLPHVTVQCPVYKEGLQGVIMPTVKSIEAAMSTYVLQGGSANLFVNDDGLQLLSEEERQARIDFYSDHGIGWVARPGHKVNGFIRRGKFKKASNMNFALTVSCKVEDKLAAIDRSPSWSQNDEAAAYEQALREVLEESEGRAWADGNIRIGDYILIIDSDTRIPTDCLLDAVSEMEQSPEVGILQFSSGVMQVIHTYFENGITFFTNLVYTAIRYAVANGDVAPFVGHNAILRWSAVQQVAYNEDDGSDYEKFWSESHVSEDFDMALRLQMLGYIVRYSSWAGDGFKEGVSLTVYDELARWEKYAYGCSELMFNPLRQWIFRGPFTPLFRQFIFSNMPITSKVTICGYMGTYFALGATWILTLANYFLLGWFNGYLDKFYLGSWEVWFSVIVVFTLLGNTALAVMRYRIGDKGLVSALLENAKWVFLLSIFLGGVSFHISQALLCHLFGIDMTWGATAKEAEFSNFFIEVPKVLKKFKFSMTCAVLTIVGVVIMCYAPFIPHDWLITEFIAIFPLVFLCSNHILLPIALNPALMTFTW